MTSIQFIQLNDLHRKTHQLEVSCGEINISKKNRKHRN